MTTPPLFDPNPAANGLVIVDLQNFTVTTQTVPNTGEEVLANAKRLADCCRSLGVPVFRVCVGGPYSASLALQPPHDAPMPPFEFTADAFDYPASLCGDGDIIIHKYNWGAFYGTDLDMQLRRRGITTLIVCGIASNYGVESTVRQAHERNYAQVIVSDATAAFTTEEHRYPMEVIFPRIARVRTTGEALKGLSEMSPGDRGLPA